MAMQRIFLSLAALGMLSGQAVYAASPAVLPNSANGDPLNAPFGGVVALVVGTPASPARSIAAVCTVAGNMSITLLDGSTLVWPVAVGGQTLPFAVTTVNSAGTTATCTYYNLL